MHRVPTITISAVDEPLASLQKPGAFDYPVTETVLLETHISWVIIAGDYAYKIKKPVKLEFLDFSSLEKRRFYCEEELRLNKPWAPDIYIDVVPVTVSDGQAQFGGPGEAIEYAVRMHSFDQQQRLDRQLEAGRLTVDDMKALASIVAARHEQADVVPASARARVLNLTGQFMDDNFAALQGQLDEARLAQLRQWTVTELALREALLGRRFDNGFVRDCHGDLHLGNLVRSPGGMRMFDCIEFSTDLRHIDTMCDTAFLVMDLVSRSHPELAAHFINRYLEVIGDYEGIALLDLFFVYRGLVRAKVAVIRSLERDSREKRDADLREAAFYCDLAGRQAAGRQPLLAIMHGLSGSGKTWVSARLMAALPAIRVRSDVERKRLHGLLETTSSHSPVGRGIYTEQAGREVYRHLFDVARTALAAGHTVIIDAAFIESAERAGARKIAAELGLPFVIVDVAAPDVVLRQRLRRRPAAGDASEANLAVLDYQRERGHQLLPGESRYTVRCDNDGPIESNALATAVRLKAAGVRT